MTKSNPKSLGLSFSKRKLKIEENAVNSSLNRNNFKINIVSCF